MFVNVYYVLSVLLYLTLFNYTDNRLMFCDTVGRGNNIKIFHTHRLMITVDDNIRLLNQHYSTGYTQYLRYCRTFAGDLAEDLISDTYILLLKAINNKFAKDGITHKYIIRSLKINYLDGKKKKSNYDNYEKVSDENLLFHEEFIENPEEYLDNLERRIAKELQYKAMIYYVERNFNQIEIAMFKMKYISGLTNKQIGTILSTNKYKYSETKISLIFKNIMIRLKDNFNK